MFETPQVIQSYVMGQWQSPKSKDLNIHDAVFGKLIGYVSSDGIDVADSINYGRLQNKSLRKLSFHDRALRLKALAQHLNSKKEDFYTLSYFTGATRKDSWIDIEGGISTLFSYASMARKVMPNERFMVEDDVIPLSKDNSFSAHHLLTPLEGVAIHINAFNFPCWGMLEKMASSFIAGLPCIVKPAPQTAYLCEAMVKEIIASGLLPEGSLQLISGDVVDFLEHVDEQDVVSFTGSAATGKRLKAHDNVIDKSVRFNLEADSLNCAILGESVQVDDVEFELFVKEVAREMTAKAGQKCTAIRRVVVPKHMVEPVSQALEKRLAKTVMGNPRDESVRMGPLVSQQQKESVTERVALLRESCELVFQDSNFAVVDGDKDAGGFYPPTILYCDKPIGDVAAHTVEAFGPVATLLPYDTLEEAAEIARLGRGSLVSSVISDNQEEVQELVFSLAPHHGRIHVLNKNNAKSSTGHGSPLPQLKHGGPGRAGGSEELGGIRSIKHFMQRTAIQADPSMLMGITKRYNGGAQVITDKVHPFKKNFNELQIGESLLTHRRTVTEADIVNFANISGDNFYAHVDEIAAKESLFGKRVAHGYFLVSAAAGLFVDPAPGPVLANYGLENLRFITPVGIGDTIRVRLTVKEKTKKEKRETEDVPTGVVEWDVQISNQDEEVVALYSILTLVERGLDVGEV